MSLKAVMAFATEVQRFNDDVADLNSRYVGLCARRAALEEAGRQIMLVSAVRDMLAKVSVTITMPDPDPDLEPESDEPGSENHSEPETESAYEVGRPDGGIQAHGPLANGTSECTG